MSTQFSYLMKPITECSDQELINWYIAFCNGANPSNEEHYKEWEEFKKEVPNRSKSFQEEIDYINSIL